MHIGDYRSRAANHQEPLCSRRPQGLRGAGNVACGADTLTRSSVFAVEGTDARILAVSLNDAYKFVRGAAGGDDVYKLRANKSELDQARKAIGGEFFGTVPIFFVDGVAFLNGEETVVPSFFDKEDLDATIEKLRSLNPDLASKVRPPMSGVSGPVRISVRDPPAYGLLPQGLILSLVARSDSRHLLSDRFGECDR